jgi:hypothetical protein
MKQNFRLKDGVKKTQPKIKVGIYILTTDHWILSELAAFSTDMARLSYDPTVPYEFYTTYITGVRPVHMARNRAVEHFIKSGFDKMWFIDDDMIPSPSSLQLLTMPGDITTGIAYRINEHKLSTCQNVAAARDPENKQFGGIVIFPDTKPALYEIDSSGTGYLVIDGKVLRDERMQFKREDGTPYWFRSQETPDGHTIQSEDIDFTWRAKCLGYRILANSGVKVGHVKEVDLMQCGTLFDWLNDARDKGNTPPKPAADTSVEPSAFA